MTLIALQPRQIAQHLAVAAFCSWPIFNFLANNFAENIISNAVLLAFAAVYALALLLSLTAQQIFKLHAAKYILPAGFLSFFCFGLWIDLFEKFFELERFTAVFSLIGIVLQFALLSALILKVASFNSARRIALVGFITLFLPSLIAIGSGLADFTKKNLDVVQAKVEDNTQALKLKPNIYFIVLDMYARQDVLKDQLRIDNSEFLKGMEARGFVVDRQSFSNYPTTPLTLSTSFNMDFYSFTKDYSVDLILGHSPVVSFFKEKGYQFIFVDSGGNSQISCSGFEDHCFGSGNIDDDMALLLQMTPLWRMMRSGSFYRYFEALYLLTDLEQSLAEVSDHLERTRQPSFVFAHILSPHEPARFTSSCELLFTTNPGLGSATSEQYRNDLPCLNEQVLRSVDLILETDKSDPIILIQSDHGIRGVEFASNDELLDLKNLMTFLLPDSCRSSHYPGMTPVNNFRLVISCITGTPFKPVEDRLLIWNGKTRKTFNQVAPDGTLIRTFGD